MCSRTQTLIPSLKVGAYHVIEAHRIVFYFFRGTCIRLSSNPNHTTTNGNTNSKDNRSNKGPYSNAAINDFCFGCELQFGVTPAATTASRDSA
mmetsp:Transcript_35620/g.59043  ORF Transcript_35620/g.59043 Transcript_35620/m.59043 type:complete len:93 (-) Transcript_35620:115-393(-)